MSARVVELLKNRLAGLFASSKARHAKVIVTSNHAPTADQLTEFALTSDAALAAPYFTVEDVRELVAQSPAPKNDPIDGWARIVHLSATGGHPLLVTAKIANLRARNWPHQVLLEDFGPNASEAIQDTRASARRRLLAELPPTSTARAVLVRASAVFQSFEDGLVYQLCHDAPPVPQPADALAVLKGSWIEPAPDGGWRLSPLLSDLNADIAPEQTHARRILFASACPVHLRRDIFDRHRISGRTGPVKRWICKTSSKKL